MKHLTHSSKVYWKTRQNQ